MQSFFDVDSVAQVPSSESQSTPPPPPPPPSTLAGFLP